MFRKEGLSLRTIFFKMEVLQLIFSTGIPVMWVWGGISCEVLLAGSTVSCRESFMP
jgi:hypothetical protein